ncbi:hypothetical protein K6V72_00090 [Ralstonia insidiosa]|uniref:Uncharacterized protein n=1 Tax=Ralstonia insidiosa TaxID=190721 RepID=A0A191ZWJ5_9RALS|nr:hypothetical protein [Ralstonia insidiosa]ANJ72441.1 hypothetical protein A9Y76_08145 [Ralstonia insidiosa]KAB0472984.1 hypothetical protein F7R11_10690 [Ralstonia insidiosa]MBY4907380.1 hypothetical protein [Ralstonia insidiosa]
MSDYNLRELEEIIAAGEDKLEEFADLINEAFEEGLEANDGLRIGAWTEEERDEVMARYNHLCAVAEALRERVDYLRAELDEANAAMADAYEVDLQEAIEDYLDEGGELDEEGQPTDKDLLADVFRRMQDSRLENGQ